MADSDFEHEREFGKDEAGYRCGAGDVHGVDAMLYKGKRYVCMGRERHRVSCPTVGD